MVVFHRVCPEPVPRLNTVQIPGHLCLGLLPSLWRYFAFSHHCLHKHSDSSGRSETEFFTKGIEILFQRVIHFFSLIPRIIQHRPSLRPRMLVKNMHESVVKNHLVKRQLLLQDKFCEFARIVRSDACFLSFAGEGDLPVFDVGQGDLHQVEGNILLPQSWYQQERVLLQSIRG